MKTRRKMKPSGIPWLGDVPEEWGTSRVGYLLTEINRRSDDGKGEPLSMSQKLGIVPSKEIEVANPASSYVGAKIVSAGDLVLNKLKAHLGVFAISKHDGLVSPDYAVYHAKDNVSVEYLNYVFHTPPCISEFRRRITGVAVGFNRLYTSDLSKVVVPFPPLPEQRLIAGFLDGVGARIDGLKAKMACEIERLEAYKRSFIAEAVAGRFTGKAKRKMKPSGIPWLGNVPEEWEAVPLYKLVSQVRSPNEGTKEKNLLSLSYGRIIRKDMETASGLVPENYSGYNRIEANDIVLRLTDLQNDQKSLRVGLSHERGIVTSAYLTIRPSEDCCVDFLAYAIKVFDFKKGFYGIGSGVRQSLKYGEVKKIAMPLPPLAEQREIAAMIDRRIAAIDAVIAKRKAERERLDALKKSIICEAVTGRKEIR